MDGWTDASIASVQSYHAVAEEEESSFGGGCCRHNFSNTHSGIIGGTERFPGKNEVLLFFLGEII